MCVPFFLLNSVVEHCFGFNFQTDHHLARERRTIMKIGFDHIGNTAVSTT